MTVELRHKFVCLAEPNQLLQAIADCNMGSNEKNTSIILPGDQNKVPLETNFCVQFSSFVEIYHMDIGKCDMSDGTFLKNKREVFLKGEIITPEQLYLNINYNIYIQRELLLGMIEENINLLIN